MLRRSFLFFIAGIFAASTAGGQAVTGQRVPCQNNTAAGYSCQNMDLMSFLPIDQLGGSASLNDIWGWTDPQTGSEYALVGRTDGVAFVDVSDPVNPIFLGTLPTHTTPTTWRDVKVYSNHAYVVSEARNHGLQVFDLTQLRDVGNSPVTFEETAHYDRFGTAHNVAINEETGFAFAVGMGNNQTPPPSYPDSLHRRCGPGLHIVNIQDPANPKFAGCFMDDNTGGYIAPGYTHDAQCVVYNGPDDDYQGRQICIGANERAISIADVTDPSNAQKIATGTYPSPGYVHQGWFGPQQRYFYQNDELDEMNNIVDSTRTIVWDLQDLDEPVVANQFLNDTRSIDHNLYVKDSLMLQANYTSGLRIFDISNPTTPQEIAFFDTTPNDERQVFEGAWSNYPYFESGNVVVSSIGEGLFVLRPTGAARLDTSPPPPSPGAFTLTAYPNPFRHRATITVQPSSAQHVTVTVYDAMGRRVQTLHEGRLPPRTSTFVLDASSLSSGTYFVHASTSEATVTRAVAVVR